LAIRTGFRAIFLAPSRAIARRLRSTRIKSKRLANSLAERGDFAEAENCFRDLLHRQPNFADAHYNLGNANLNHGDTAGAIEC
jgi:TolA-binding protein